MMSDIARCSLCGEPMPENETMFKFHGYSGPCPKPPKPKPRMLSMIKYFSREQGNKFFLDVEVDGNLHRSLAFDTEQERSVAYGDLITMIRQTGGTDARTQ
jgi:hypothetical protein